MNEFLGWAHTLATTFRFARPWWLLLLAVLPWFWWIARPAKQALPFISGALSAGPGTSVWRARATTRNPGSTLGRLAMRSVIVVTTVLGIAGLTVASPVVGSQPSSSSTPPQAFLPTYRQARWDLPPPLSMPAAPMTLGA